MIIHRRPPRIVANPFIAALDRLGIDWHDVAQMRVDLHAAIARANNDLLHSFNRSTR